MAFAFSRPPALVLVSGDWQTSVSARIRRTINPSPLATPDARSRIVVLVVAVVDIEHDPEVARSPALGIIRPERCEMVEVALADWVDSVPAVLNCRQHPVAVLGSPHRAGEPVRSDGQVLLGLESPSVDRLDGTDPISPRADDRGALADQAVEARAWRQSAYGGCWPWSRDHACRDVADHPSSGVVDDPSTGGLGGHALVAGGDRQDRLGRGNRNRIAVERVGRNPLRLLRQARELLTGATRGIGDGDLPEELEDPGGLQWREPRLADGADHVGVGDSNAVACQLEASRRHAADQLELGLGDRCVGPASCQQNADGCQGNCYEHLAHFSPRSVELTGVAGVLYRL